MFPNEEDASAYLPAGFYEYYQPRQPERNYLPLHQQQPASSEQIINYLPLQQQPAQGEIINYLPLMNYLPLHWQQLAPLGLPPLLLWQAKERFLMQDYGGLSASTDNSRFLSFLEDDNSFLTPWNWDPDHDPENANGLNDGSKKYMKLAAGSLFSVQPPTAAEYQTLNNNGEENMKVEAESLLSTQLPTTADQIVNNGEENIKVEAESLSSDETLNNNGEENMKVEVESISLVQPPTTADQAPNNGMLDSPASEKQTLNDDAEEVDEG